MPKCYKKYCQTQPRALSKYMVIMNKSRLNGIKQYLWVQELIAIAGFFFNNPLDLEFLVRSLL